MKKGERKVTLKVVRVANGKKQSDIAARLKELGRNVDQTRVSVWERGAETPSIEVAIDLAKAYEITLLELIAALGFDLHGVVASDEN
jgi:transcriptional regulator with XRE-family HTH domain